MDLQDLDPARVAALESGMVNALISSTGDRTVALLLLAACDPRTPLRVVAGVTHEREYVLDRAVDVDRVLEARGPHTGSGTSRCPAPREGDAREKTLVF